MEYAVRRGGSGATSRSYLSSRGVPDETSVGSLHHSNGNYTPDGTSREDDLLAWMQRRVEKLEQETRALCRKTGESATRTSSACIIDELKHINSRIKLERWAEGRDELSELRPGVSLSEIVSHLEGMFEEHRFCASIGPHLLSMCDTRYDHVENAITRHVPEGHKLAQLVRRVVRQQQETATPQVIVATGASGSGKTYTSYLCLSHLFHYLGDPAPGSQLLRRLTGVVQAISLMTTCRTAVNKDTSRFGSFYELQLLDGRISQVKSHHVFLNQTRLVRRPLKDNNYHVFYAMLEGLSGETLNSLFLPDRSGTTYRILSNTIDDIQEKHSLATRFGTWTSGLASVGVEAGDVLKVLSACLLLGNLQFRQSRDGCDLHVANDDVLKNISNLLGVQSISLGKALTTRTVTSRGQVLRTLCSEDGGYRNAGNLAQALYVRVVNSVIKRANSLNCAQPDTPESAVPGSLSRGGGAWAGVGGGSLQRTLSLQSARLPAHMDSNFIGVLDLFGIDSSEDNSLETLCVNLCAETLEYFFKTHAFKNVEEYHREECMQPVALKYYDNGPIVDLISSQKSGVLSVFDRQVSLLGGNPDALFKVADIFEGTFGFSQSSGGRCFTIEHFSVPVTYSVPSLVEDLKQGINDDLISSFSGKVCTSPFATQLFSQELKWIEDSSNNAKGTWFRITPLGGAEAADWEKKSFCQDFHAKLDSLLKVLVRARPTFVRCVRPCVDQTVRAFNPDFVEDQCFSLQVEETVHCVQTACVHRTRHKQFVRQHSHFLHPSSRNVPIEEKVQLIACEVEKSIPKVSKLEMKWVTNRKYVFYSESFRKQLCFMLHNSSGPQAPRTPERDSSPHKPAVGHAPVLIKPPIGRKNSNPAQANNPPDDMPPPAFASSTLPLQRKGRDEVPKESLEDFKRASGIPQRPQLPPSRKYSVTCDTKLKFPHYRRMLRDFPPQSAGNGERPIVRQGELVQAVAASDRRGRLLLVKDGNSLNVPASFTHISQ